MSTIYEEVSPEKWLVERKNYFSMDMNGYDKPPSYSYMPTLHHINRNGKIMDLGCGNGMLLKFLIKFSGKQLEPFGIDHNEECIYQAVSEVLPEYAQNFRICDIINYYFLENSFDIIIANPFHTYTKYSIAEFTKQCIESLNYSGRLIYRIHDDVLENINIETIEDIEDFSRFIKNSEMKAYHYQGITICTADKRSF